MSWTGKRFTVPQFGAPLALDEETYDTLPSGSVLVKLSAASLNFRDLLVRDGAYNPRFRLPLVPVSDGAGEVVAIGSDVRQTTIGQRVMIAYMEGWQDGPLTDEIRRTTLGGPVDGVLRQYRLVAEGDIVQIPEDLSFADAACLPCAGVTAWAALHDHCKVKAGDWVLVQGTGGVSLFALQFAKAMGARVAVISSSDEKLKVAKSLGADHLHNYKTEPDWAPAILGAIGPMDHVIEVGGAGTLKASLKVVATAGNVALIGVLAGVETPLAVTSVLMRAIKLHGIAVGSKRNLQDMVRAMNAHGIKPVIGARFAFKDVESAMDTLRAGKTVGKIVLEGFHD